MSQKTQKIQVVPIHTFPAWGYLIVSDEIVAVDVGAPSVAERMAEIVRTDLKRDLSDLKWIVATHYHVDHIGGIPRLLDLTSAKVMFHRATRGHIENGDRLLFPPARRWPNMLINRIDIPEPKTSWRDIRTIARIGLPFWNQRLSFSPEGYYQEGDELPGGSGFMIVETPGHTPCSVCFHNENSRELITGDTILGGRRGPESNTFVINREEIARSARKLKTFPVEKLYPGHGLLLDEENLLAAMDDIPVPDGLKGLRVRRGRDS